MPSWPLALLIIVLLAALLGFSGIAGPAAWMAKLCFSLFLLLFLASITAGRKRHSQRARSPEEPK
jgi:uncharacterized membrane protein YtjA (UPF0391 family)